VLIARCAWHRRYYGFGRLLGVSRWRGLRIGFTDGICRKCAARVRSDLRVSRAGGPVAADRRGWMPGIAAVALAVIVAVLLFARPTHELPAPVTVAPIPSATIRGAAVPAASPALLARAPRLQPPLAVRPRPAAIPWPSPPGRPISRTIVHRTDSVQSP
jgi:hypothetical protein